MGKCRHVKYDGQFFEQKPPRLAFPIINQVRTSFSYLGQIVIAQLRHGGILPCSRGFRGFGFRGLGFIGFRAIRNASPNNSGPYFLWDVSSREGG